MCVNSTDCSLHLTFLSHQHVVIEVIPHFSKIKLLLGKGRVKKNKKKSNNFQFLCLNNPPPPLKVPESYPGRLWRASRSYRSKLVQDKNP